MTVNHPFDLLGNIVIVKFPLRFPAAGKKKYAVKILKENKGVKTVLEKIGRFKGRLRKQETKWILGEKTKETLYRENGCVFRINVDTVYFSPRLSNERKLIAREIRKGQRVFVMFAGAGPFPITIARNSKATKVWSNEINKEANNYAKLNIELNKVKDKVVLFPGDVKKVVRGLREKFDVIVMPRPQLTDSFLPAAFKISKKGTRVFYYDFCKDDEVYDVLEKVTSEATKAKRKIKITEVRKAGEVGPHRYRVLVGFKIVK